MTIGIVAVFCLLHLVMIGATMLATWLSGNAGTFGEALAPTPLAALLGETSDYGRGSLDRSTFEEATNQVFGPVKTFYGLFSFEYDWLNGEGIGGFIGLLFSAAGHVVAAWLLYKVATAALGGFASLLNR